MTQPQQDVKFSVTEEGPAEMHLRRAILVYASKGGGSFATVHDVAANQAGVPFSAEAADVAHQTVANQVILRRQQAHAGSSCRNKGVRDQAISHPRNWPVPIGANHFTGSEAADEPASSKPRHPST